MTMENLKHEYIENHLISRVCPQATKDSRIQYVDRLDLVYSIPSRFDSMIALDVHGIPPIDKIHSQKRVEFAYWVVNEPIQFDFYIGYAPEIDTVFVAIGQEVRNKNYANKRKVWLESGAPIQ